MIDVIDLDLFSYVAPGQNFDLFVAFGQRICTDECNDERQIEGV